MVLVVAWWTAIEEGLLRSRVVNDPELTGRPEGVPSDAVDLSGDGGAFASASSLQEIRARVHL
jgi:hypothetical protein